MDLFKLILLIFLTTLFLLIHSTSSTCPIPCNCDEDKLIVNCVKNGFFLDFIPITLNPAVKEINIINNKIKKINLHGGFSEFYQSLNKINLSRNQIDTISPGSFTWKLGSLREVDLSFNLISVIDEATFNNLKVDNANGNNNNINIESLNLSNNKLKNLNKEGIFKYLTKLKKLDLSFNEIDILNVNQFNFNLDLEDLRLDNNLLSFVPFNFGSYNNFNSSRVAATSSSSSRAIHLASTSLASSEELTQELILRETLFENSFLENGELLENVESLKKIWKILYNYDLNLNINDNDNDNLKDKNIAQNNNNNNNDYDQENSDDSDSITSNKILKKLKVLNLSNNRIKIIKNHQFLHLTSLSKLDLSNNKLVFIFSDSFFNLGSLNELNLSGNYLLHLPFFTFTHFLKLQKLGFSDNSYISSIDFYNNSNNNNNSSSSNNNSNNNNNNEIINYNILNNLVELNFENLYNLNYINDFLFFQSQGQSDPEEDQKKTQNKDEIFKNRRIKVNFKSLSKFSLTNSKIEFLHPNLFFNLNKLSFIDLQNNSLKTISKNLFINLINGNGSVDKREDEKDRILLELFTSKWINVNGNPFICNCNLNWLIQLFKTHENDTLKTAAFEDDIDLKCSGPPNLKDKPIWKISMNCFDFEYKNNTLINTLIISSAIILLIIIFILLYKYNSNRNSSKSHGGGGDESPSESSGKKISLCSNRKVNDINLFLGQRDNGILRSENENDFFIINHGRTGAGTNSRNSTIGGSGGGRSGGGGMVGVGVGENNFYFPTGNEDIDDIEEEEDEDDEERNENDIFLINGHGHHTINGPMPTDLLMNYYYDSSQTSHPSAHLHHLQHQHQPHHHLQHSQIIPVQPGLPNPGLYYYYQHQQQHPLSHSNSQQSSMKRQSGTGSAELLNFQRGGGGGGGRLNDFSTSNNDPIYYEIHHSNNVPIINSSSSNNDNVPITEL